MPRSRRSRRLVTLAFPIRISQSEQLLRGIFDYTRAHTNWEFANSVPIFDLPIDRISDWRSDGIITFIGSAREATIASSMKIPVVNLSSRMGGLGMSRVNVDNAAVGRLAADHLSFRGYRHFAFYGVRNAFFSDERGNSFCQALSRFGHNVFRRSVPTGSKRHIWRDSLASLGRWIEKLPTPLGLFGVNDTAARMAVRACALIGRRVPDEVGVIGMDNDEVICAFGTPTLSSIAREWYTIGYEAAKLLDQLIECAHDSVKDHLIEPRGVIIRESTDTFVSADPLVSKAISFSRQNTHLPFGVDQLVDIVGGSRRRLEMAFRRSLNITPIEFLDRLRIEKAKRLLNSNDLTLTQIAVQCGYTDLRQFRRAFHRTLSMTPANYRDQHADGSSQR